MMLTEEVADLTLPRFQKIHRSQASNEERKQGKYRRTLPFLTGQGNQPLYDTDGYHYELTPFVEVLMVWQAPLTGCQSLSGEG